MQMEMLVSIDVVERETGRQECFELRRDFGFDLTAHPGKREYGHARDQHVSPKAAIRTDEIRHGRGWRHWPALDQDEVQSDLERREPARPRNGIVRGVAAHHQARGGQNAFPVCRLDRFVDLKCEAEIVGRDDEALQCATLRRSRRKWKNSTPSRSRRLSICGLASISPAIAAILSARK